ncbi:hypothetical protein [Zavarzinella formosa]|uniref:hypothetical protein n=1 Tax=Zavarzinella formosa TaxID=360055 RepID=UPI000316C0CE|nr:hypothetical protein [Zavarzinella formosa]
MTDQLPESPRIVARETPGDIYSKSLVFVNPALQIETTVCTAENFTRMNTPYAADEFFSFDENLSFADGRWTLTVDDIVDSLEVKTTRRIFQSDDDGRTWKQTK